MGQGGRIFVNGRGPEHRGNLTEVQDLEPKCLQGWGAQRGGKGQHEMGWGVSWEPHTLQEEHSWVCGLGRVLEGSEGPGWPDLPVFQEKLEIGLFFF